MATIIISESQLRLVRRIEEGRVLYGDFERAFTNYMKELRKNPNHPRLDGFFSANGIGEEELLNKMMDLGLISRKDDIDEPENASGKRRSMHSRQYTFYNRDYNDKLDKLYDSFFKDGYRRELNEEEGMGGGFAGPSAGGASTDAGLNVGTADTSGGIVTPFGKVQRRKIGTKTTDDITRQESNIDMAPTAERKNICCRRKK